MGEGGGGGWRFLLAFFRVPWFIKKKSIYSVLVAVCTSFSDRHRGEGGGWGSGRREERGREAELRVGTDRRVPPPREAQFCRVFWWSVCVCDQVIAQRSSSHSLFSRSRTLTPTHTPSLSPCLSLLSLSQKQAVRGYPTVSVQKKGAKTNSPLFFSVLLRRLCFFFLLFFFFSALLPERHF